MDAVSVPQVPSVASYSAGKSFGPRTWAYIIDELLRVALTYVAGVAAALPAVVWLMIIGRSVEELPSDRPSTYVIGLIGSVLYFVLFEWLYGATPGKVLLHMRKELFLKNVDISARVC